jgi:pyruvate/2-oxoglutarate dehydrogenase complex dihydrolipoamide dehydrogenase (E3) component
MHLVARRAAEFGVEVQGQVRFRLDQAVGRKDSIVKGIHRSIHGALERRKEEIVFLRGEARFLNEHEIDTGDGRLNFDKAIVATGARRVVPPIPGLDEVEFLTNQTALDLTDLPSSMIIVGGGYVGIEFAQMYGRFGTQVTLLGRNSRLAPTEDPDLAQLLAGYLREEGIQVHTSAPVTSLRKDGQESVASAMVDGEEREFRAEAVLLAAGRVGNTDRLDLGAAGVATVEKGFIQVDERLTTSQPNISAIGDVKGGWMFTHVATYDARVAALNAIEAAGRSVDYRVVPRVIFSDPALAAVGLTETEASEKGYDVAVGSVPVQGARPLAIGDARGRLKVVVNRTDGEILGCHILAPHADDLLHEVVTAMHDHGRIDRIGKSIHAHPTLSEMVKAAARAAN